MNSEPSSAPNAAPAVTPRPAATLLLLRDGAAGIEVLMVTRHVEMAFAAGALVFPGGRIDPADGDPAVSACCRNASGAAPAALACRVAAIRESFEEAHILLARAAGERTLLSARDLAALEARLADRLGRAPQFADFAASGAVELATDLLVPYAHWITPVGRPKRFDTQFFLAPAPPDQTAVHDGREAVDTTWVSPPDALAAADAGRATLVFATRMNLVKLARSGTVAAALAAARADTIVTVCPELLETPEGRKLCIPLAAGYGVAEVPAQGIPRA